MRLVDRRNRVEAMHLLVAVRLAIERFESAIQQGQIIGRLGRHRWTPEGAAPGPVKVLAPL
jgi:hypothetical protein